ncbi:MAG: response regulator [Candidatus Fimivivens sp.]|nr:response regulator [Candidatus Fimivivens sp.]
MEDIRVVIVDDSAFSIAFIRNILENNGYKVVGTAKNLEEVSTVVKEQKPTLVTMDMTLPGTDGFECTRAVHEIDKDIKVIVISAMMDDELIKEAKDNKISAYIQKPIDEDALVTTIKRIMASEELYQLLINENFEVFKESLLDGMNRMTKSLVTYDNEFSANREQKSQGITVIIGIIGKFSGRMLLDFSKETATKIASAIFGKNDVSQEETLEAMSEFANIVAGNACSILNRKDKAFGLRMAPPSTLSGDSVLISAPQFNTTTVTAQTSFGQLVLNVGFQRGEDEWM